MEPIHVKIDFGEAVTSKKDLLSCQLNLLKIVKNIQDYRKARKVELTSRARIRSAAKRILSEIKHFREEMPKTKAPKVEKIKAKVELEKKIKKSRLESELKDIKERLERLTQA